MSQSAHFVGEEHLQAGIDAILGIDPSQAPSDPSALAERLTVPQPGVVHALQMLVHQPNGRRLVRAAPLVFSLLEAASIAHPESWGEVKSKTFATAILAAGGEAKALFSDGAASSETSALEQRQPVLTGFVHRHLAPEGALVKALSQDEKLGVAALLIGTLRAIDRHFDGGGQPMQAVREPGRNDPCHCGSGRKFKKCHGAPGGPPAP